MHFFGVALAALACIPWNKVPENIAPEKAVHLCPGEVARMLRFSYWDIDGHKLPYRALLVVRSDHTVAVQTSTHKTQMTLNAAQRDDLKDAIDSFPEFHKLLIAQRSKDTKLPSADGGIDFYLEMRRGSRIYAWNNIRYTFENGYGGVPLISNLEVYQYLLQPSQMEKEKAPEKAPEKVPEKVPDKDKEKDPPAPPATPQK